MYVYAKGRQVFKHWGRSSMTEGVIGLEAAFVGVLKNLSLRIESLAKLESLPAYAVSKECESESWTMFHARLQEKRNM
ncbi:Protein of unknown function [Pyronema omphalodes CBS 100304]|uniref:Uncharacterized protein n=1 Tax=Pyronema omphalodes (strain CBS 100304) TaxID=1076935 RepID=U4KVE3_PYROM|nr:Protein of unknown function [Pyronema omphalodes CBS 100304]